MKMPARHVKDRRVIKTKDRLHGALGALIREKNYDRIVVKEILDRADVGRSTFYMHFRDKDDLLVSHIQDIVHKGPPSTAPNSSTQCERIIWFSLPILEHIHQHISPVKPEAATMGQAALHERLRKILVALITEKVKHICAQGKTVKTISLDVLAAYVASTFILVLNWWLESQNALTPKEVDGMFRSLILPSLTANWA